MNEPRVWLKPDLVARLELMSLAEDGDDLVLAYFGDDLQFRSSRVDDLDHGLGAVVRSREMLRAHAINGRASIAAGRRIVERECYPGGRLECRRSVPADADLEPVHRRRTHKTHNG